MRQQSFPLLIQSSPFGNVAATARVVQRVTALSDRLGLGLEPILNDSSDDDEQQQQRRHQVLQQESDNGLLFLVVTGGTEAATLNDVRQSGARAVGLVAHSELNSLPAALEIAAYFTRQQEPKQNQCLLQPFGI